MDYFCANCGYISGYAGGECGAAGSWPEGSLCSLLHFINYNIKYISLAIVKAISEHDPTIEKDIKDYSEIDKIIYRVKPPISE